MNHAFRKPPLEERVPRRWNASVMCVGSVGRGVGRGCEEGEEGSIGVVCEAAEVWGREGDYTLWGLGVWSTRKRSLAKGMCWGEGYAGRVRLAAVKELMRLCAPMA